MSLQSAAEALARGQTPPGAALLKDRRVRRVAVVDGTLLKVYLSKPSQARREARALRLARERDLPVPELVDCGANWVAMRFLAGREARRDDLEAILPEVERMHEHGMLHEQNPVARHVLAQGHLSVMAFKFGLVLIGSYPLLRFRRARIAELGAFVVFVAYALLAVRWSVCFKLYALTLNADGNLAELQRASTTIPY